MLTPGGLPALRNASPGAPGAAGASSDARDPAACLAATVALAVPSREPVLLAVSGGSDSMALLAAALRPLAGRLAVAHVRHHLRADAGRDAALVEDTCRQLGLPCLAVDAGPGPADPARTETAARRRRLGALREAAHRAGSRWILLAHHRDDDLETLLLRLQRGHSGDRALCGIPTVRALDDDAVLLRPFLLGPRPPGRAALARLRRAAGLPHVEDSTNADERIPRNRIRAALARDEPLAPDRLLSLRNAARGRLAGRLAALTSSLAEGLQPEGLGARLLLAALPDAALSGPGDDLAELLRLLGGCLQRRRRMDPRAAVLRELAALVARRTGTLRLPAAPAAVEVSASRHALHLPHEPLREDGGHGAARPLGALLATSLYL
jgi:tRNA(Ile)-lysidine synthase